MLDWVDDADQGRPWFLFVNYVDAHRPYNTSALPADRAGELPPPPPESANSVKTLDALIQQVFLHDEAPGAEMVQRVIDCYDLGLANLDSGLGALLDGLAQRGLLDATLVVVTADHGEYFGEHDLAEHSKDIYEPVLRVPLIVKQPSQIVGRVIERATSIVDVPGWILRDAVPSVAAAHPGKFRGSAEIPETLAFVKYAREKDLSAAWGPRFQREREVIYVDNLKLIRSSDGQHELFDLAVDSGETHNLFAERPEQAATLMQRLEQRLANAEPGGEPVVAAPPTADGLRAMRALGYTGG